jgi:5-methylcytosine-specific restriction endonuclease McrA
MPSHHTAIVCPNCGNSDEGKGSKGLCLPCHHAAYYAERKPQILAQMVAYYAANRDRKLTYQKGYAAAHVEEVKLNQALQYRMHREERIAYSVKYVKEHPKEHQEQTQVRRARLRAAYVERVSLRVLFDRDRGICQICRKPVIWDDERRPYRPSGDHIVPLSAGGKHELANMQLAHRRCNYQRNKHGPAQTRLWG